jgi:hypothetical protein
VSLRTLPARTDCDDNDIRMTAAHDSSKDEPLDAFVEGPASAPLPIDDNPYASRIQPLRLPPPAGSDNQVIRVAFLRFKPPTPARYMVPRRFGMSAILGIVTALAILFGGFRLLNAPPAVYLFFGLQTLVICFAQMLHGKAPRLASSLAGAVLAPLFLMPIIASEMHHWERRGLPAAMISIFLLVFGVPIGAFLGYLTGTCAAGIFLVMDYLEKKKEKSVGLHC